MSYVVGLTGGIGSGKSTVGLAFAALGADILDADAVSHQLTQKNQPGWQAIRDAFGPLFFTPGGELDRSALRRTVFADPISKARLEALLHPLIGNAMLEAQSRWRGPYGMLMVPLLLESGRYRDRIQRLLVVDCPEEQQVRRVVARSGMDEDEVRAIMTTQVSRAERLAAADDVIDNSGPPAMLQEQVLRLDRAYRERASDPDRGQESRTGGE